MSDLASRAWHAHWQGALTCSSDYSWLLPAVVSPTDVSTVVVDGCAPFRNVWRVGPPAAPTRGGRRQRPAPELGRAADGTERVAVAPRPDTFGGRAALGRPRACAEAPTAHTQHQTHMRSHRLGPHTLRSLSSGSPVVPRGIPRLWCRARACAHALTFVRAPARAHTRMDMGRREALVRTRRPTSTLAAHQGCGLSLRQEHEFGGVLGAHGIRGCRTRSLH